MDQHRPDYDPVERQNPYSDYYSTSGRYQPPRQPKNHGWLLAVIGVVLLCMSAGAALSRSSDHDDVQAEAREEIAAVTASSPVEEASAEIETQQELISNTAAIGTGTKLTISGDEGDELTLQEVYKLVIPSVVSITAISDNGTATGTGIIMSADGYIITNYHVVSTAQNVSVLLTSGEEYQAARVGGDETSDLMVLKIEATGLQAATFGDSDLVEVGDSVVAIGDPLGTELRGTMTNGIISGINRDVNVNNRTMTLLQTNAALNSGNSGGPLVNMQGQVIGINTMKISSQYSSVEGLGLAIPISAAKPIVDELMEKGYVTGRPEFGFSVETLEYRVMMYYRLPGRLCIGAVEPGSGAEQAGIEVGDIILAVNGIEVTTVDEISQIRNSFVAGDTVNLTIYRDGEEKSIDIVLMDQARKR